MPAQEKQQSIKVWDLFIRLFHWTLVIAFVVSYLTEGEINLHFYSGWYIALLLVLRILWGFFGSQHARFVDFIKPPTEILTYAKSLFQSNGSSIRYMGHNPLGGLMVVALLISLSLTCVTGVMLYTSEGNPTFSFVDKPLLAEFDDDEHENQVIESGNTSIKSEAQEEDEEDEAEHHENDSDEFWEEIHDLFANITLLLVLLHIAGVVIASRQHGENLVKAMINGKKEL